MPAPLDYLATGRPAQGTPGATMAGPGGPPDMPGSPAQGDGPGGIPPHILNAIINGGGPGGAPSGPPVGMQAPGSDGGSAKWGVLEQADGTILLHVKNADGSMGPVVQVIAPKQPKAPAAAGGSPQ